MWCVGFSCLCSEFCSRGRFQTSPSLSSPQDVAEDQSGRREPCLSPSQSGCISVAFPPPHPLLPHPVASPRTDDVTDCCEHCFHGNAHHRFGLHFRQLSLHSPTTPSLPHSLPSLPSLLPSLLTTRLMRRRDSDIRGEEKEGWGGY